MLLRSNYKENTAAGLGIENKDLALEFTSNNTNNTNITNNNNITMNESSIPDNKSTISKKSVGKSSVSKLGFGSSSKK